MKDNKIMITTVTTYLPDQSIIEEHRFLWSYEITVRNDSDEMIQLLKRYWRITDMTSHIEEVEGHGVVGLQPVIKPGTKFSYTSFCQLLTPQGTMEGHYEMQTLNTDIGFIVPIPKFILSSSAASLSTFRSRLH